MLLVFNLGKGGLGSAQGGFFYLLGTKLKMKVEIKQTCY